MSFWDNVRKFAQPYAEDDYDDYDEDEDYGDEYEEEEQPRRTRRTSSRSSTRRRAPEPEADEDDEPEEDDYGFSAAASPAPRASTVSAGSFSGTVLKSPSAASVSNKQAVVLFHPAAFSDTSKAADDLRDQKAVVVNMENVDKAMARRVVDFLSGAVYALDGNVRKIAQSVYLFCPHNMNIEGDLDTIRSEAEVESYV